MLGEYNGFRLLHCHYSLAEGEHDLDNAAKDLRDASHFSAVAAPVSEHGSHNDTPSPSTAGARTPLPLSRQVSYGAQTSAEVAELERMITNAATTPRKAKRVCNMSVDVQNAVRTGVIELMRGSDETTY